MIRRSIWALAIVSLMSCTDAPRIIATPMGADTGDRDARAGDAAAPPRDPPSCDETLGRPVVRRLTSTQIDNTLSDLFASPDVPSAGILVDPAVRGYDADVSAAVIRDLAADQWMRRAESIAEWAVPEHLDRLTSCTDTGATCRVDFVQGLGLHLYRRPLEDRTVTAYLELLFDERDFESGARVMLATMLQSPHFLYRMEIGEPVPDAAGQVALGPYELASALSFLVTNAAPDAELLDAAGEGRLVTEGDLERELGRLFATPRASQALGHFARQWLLVDNLEEKAKDPAVLYPDAVRAAMLRETESFFVDAFESGGGIGALFGARSAPGDAELVAFYGMGERPPGVLGLGSVLTEHALADTSSPTQRGALVRRRFLCETLPPPPSGVNTMLPPRGPTQTTRERTARHTADPACAGCHRRMDPIGFALEHFDAFGRFRADENGQPIDATGEITATPDGDVPLDGAESLSRHLAASPEALACFAQNLAYYAYGVEGCTWASLVDGLTPDTPLREMLSRVVRARHFRYRRAD